ncbi:MAG: hypothetical protein AABX24_00095 [Nanoarchaeota archaeon]
MDYRTVGQKNTQITAQVSLFTDMVSDVFVYIASNYSTSGVYKTKATINSSSFSDNETGVIIS